MHRLSSVDTGRSYLEVARQSLCTVVELMYDNGGKDDDELRNSILETKFGFHSCLETMKTPTKKRIL